ncbi:MAG TPA: DOPA 4,5-dioxygenase family protein [Polyangiaceae bacterium]|nr:DOPA 4,5-dioxygenase family protein [Polyangiaceae bacterium]
MAPSSLPDRPRGFGALTSYHAHIYWNTADERERALKVREWIGERFEVALGRVHDKPVGPHTVAMYQVAFTVEVFARFAPWLMLNRQGLSVLIHPNTGRARDDHLVHALWLGSPLALLGDTLPNEPGTDGIDHPVTNTSPTLASE